MAGTDENNDLSGSEVLEHGSHDPGRLGALGRSRTVRLAASGLVATAILGWFVMGPGVPGLSSSRSPADEPATAGTARDAPANPVIARDQGEGECESEQADGASAAGTADRDRTSRRANSRSRTLAASLYRFALNPSPARKVPWAQDVALTAPGAWVVVPRSRAATGNAWTTVSGRTGDYLLADLAASKGRYRVHDTIHPDCRSEPRVVSARPIDTSWISVQAPASVRCSAWWAVDVFLDERDRIARVTVAKR